MVKFLSLVSIKLSLITRWIIVNQMLQTNCQIFQVGGVTTDGQLKPDVTAPGGNIYSSFNDNSYGSISGTSMAAPP